MWHTAWDMNPPAPGDATWDEYLAALPGEQERLERLYSATPEAEPATFTTYSNGHETVRPSAGEPLPPDAQAELRERLLGIVRLDRVEPVEPLPLLGGRLAPSAHTILFGDGDVGKGTLACQWILDAVEDGHTVLVLDYEAHRDEWTWRLDGLGGREARERVYHVNGTDWRGPLWAHLDQVRGAVAATGADIIVIDSLAVACQGFDPKDDATASLYCAAVNGLGVTVLSIAHVTKAGEDRWPYGSVFWHNLARVTWSLRTHRLGRLLRCRKSNAYRKPPLAMVGITWDGTRLREVWQRPYAEALTDAIRDVLEAGPLSATEILAKLNEDRDDDMAPIAMGHVSTSLQRLKRAGKASKDGERWTA